MDRIVHARLDEETEQVLSRLRAATGLRDSEIVRRGIRALADQALIMGSREVIGQGRFDSGVSDLGSDERHLAGFGRS